MSGDSPHPRRDGRSQEQKDKFIPPPMDPYATYQTPYERRQSSEPNPFIEFRRFADKQFSDIFSGLQTFANFPKMFGMEEGMKDLREQLEKDLKEMIAQQRVRTEELARTEEFARSNSSNRDTLLPAPTNAAISSTSDQSRHDITGKSSPDGRKESGANKIQDWITTNGIDGKEWHIDPSIGLAIPKVPDTKTPPTMEHHEDPKVRWKRGFRNCPELKKYRGETELDMYESYEDLHKPHRFTGSSVREKPTWSSWLSAYGYDGLQQSRKTSESAAVASSRQEEEPSVRKCENKTYRLGQTRRMDPFRNDHEFLPWIILSPYSPIYLANVDSVQMAAIRMHNGCEGGCDNPMHMYRHRFSNKKINSDQEYDFRAKLSGKAPWADAFEDLISLERTGKMPNREPGGCIRPKYITTDWVRDMIDKGVLGPKWWVQDGEIMRDSRDDPTGRDNLSIAQRRRREVEEAVNNLRALDLARHEDDNLTLIGFGDNFPEESRAQQQKGESTIPLQQSTATNATLPVQPESQTERSEPSSLPSKTVDITSAPTKPQQQPTQPTKPKASVISTLTTMTSRTHSDGSVETKRILKKRFADGNEESEESTEVIYPQLSKTSTKYDGSKDQQQQEKKQGWFWT